LKIQYSFYKYAYIYTEPTAKGKKALDAYSPYYFVKRIAKREINKFQDETWLVILQQEKEGNISVKFRFPWQDDANTLQKDEIFKMLKSHYLQQETSEQSSEQLNIIKQWNILREEVVFVTQVLRKFLVMYMYPALEKQIREDLTKSSEKYIVERCAANFKELLLSSPLYVQDAEKIHSRHADADRLPNKKARFAFNCSALGCVYEHKSQSLYLAFVDAAGVYHEHIVLKYLAIPNADKHVDPNIKLHYKEDENSLKVRLFCYVNGRSSSPSTAPTSSSCRRTASTRGGWCRSCATSSRSRSSRRTATTSCPTSTP